MRLLSDVKTNAVPSNIRRIRELKHYSQGYLAIKLGMSRNAYNKIELGYNNITLSRLLNIAEILEVDVIELMNSSDNELVQLHLVK
jgi:transcriptional regulator with XRE-family HTH domain